MILPVKAISWRSCLIALVLPALLFFTGCAGKAPVVSQSHGGAKKRIGSQARPGREKTTSPTNRELVGEDASFSRIRPEKAAKASAVISPSGQGLSSWMELEPYLRECLRYASTKPADVPAVTGMRPAPTWGLMARTAKLLLKLLPRLDRNPELLGQYFDWYAIKPRPVMTGYYSPEVRASYKRTGNYRYPIYGKPAKDLSGLSRKAIQNGALKGKGYEIAWADSLFDLYNLQVQGGGVLRLPDGSARPILYAGNNGRMFNPLSHIVRDKGLLPSDKLNMWAVKAFFDAKPHLLRPLLEENPSYVFFALAQAGPLGSMGSRLVPKVSVAVDPDVLPLGAVMALFAHMPDKGKSVRGLVLANDTGSAIKGAEIDFFTGHGDAAAQVAGRLKTRAWVYLLLAKPSKS